jgi:polyhydroxyalkanoate synthase
MTFVLTNGGHNAGIVSEPGHKDRSYHIRERKKGAPYLDPAAWLNEAKEKSGSWWTPWHEWLVKQSSSRQIKAPVLDDKLPPAPGTYVLQK